MILEILELNLIVLCVKQSKLNKEQYEHKRGEN
jgi:hypothetical protein